MIDLLISCPLNEKSKFSFSVLQLEVEVSRQRHDGDLREKNRLSRMLDNKVCSQWIVLMWCSFVIICNFACLYNPTGISSGF